MSNQGMNDLKDENNMLSQRFNEMNIYCVELEKLVKEAKKIIKYYYNENGQGYLVKSAKRFLDNATVKGLGK